MYTGNSAISSSKKQRPTTGYLVRPRTGRSLFSPRPTSSPSQDKKKKFKKSSGSGAGFKMDFRKKPDYADTAYREAVSRLRILLAETYTPIKRPFRELDSAGEDTDNQSLVSVNSRGSRYGGQRPYYQYLTMLPRRYHYGQPPTRHNLLPAQADKSLLNLPKYENSTAPPELMSFIEKQEDYIEQLEKESRFCRDELSTLLGKVKDVISENEHLHEKQKSNIMKSVFSHLESETETETETDLLHKSPKKGHQKSRILEGPTIVFESRISELEAQLTQSKIDLRKAIEENDNYKKKIADGSILEGVGGYDHYKTKAEALLKERDLLQESVSKLQIALGRIKDKENDTCDQVKRSLDVAEQAQYEKSAAEMEIRRLKDELDRQHSKLREAISDQGRRVADERSSVERRYTQQIEQLTNELAVQWESSNKLQLELDKQRRENTDLRRELAQKQALLDEMKKDMQNKIMNLQSDIGVNGAEKNAMEQQIATLQMATERSERQAKQEATRLQAEMQSLRQRLDRADADLIHSRRENIRLSEQVASLEKEIKISSALSEERSRTPAPSGEILALPPPREHREKEMSSLIQDMESKHAATVAELEGMIHSQNQLMDKLSVECHSLTTKLEDASARHKEEIRGLQTSLERLNNRFSQSQIATEKKIKDEDYNTTIRNQRPAPPPNLAAQPPATRQEPPQLSRKNSQEKQSPHPIPETMPQYSTEDPNLTNEQAYDPGQEQYLTAEQQQAYDQQYSDQAYYDQTGYTAEDYANAGQHYQLDPNQAYDPNQEYDPNQQYDPSQQYDAQGQEYGVEYAPESGQVGVEEKLPDNQIVEPNQPNAEH